MNDDLEQKLRRQTLSQIPSHWRGDILRATTVAQPASPSSFKFRISKLLWPSPYAWGGLAAIWFFIVLVNLSTTGGPVQIAKQPTPPSPQILLALQEQKKLLAELIGQPDAPVADRPRTQPPQPRSERTFKISAA